MINQIVLAASEAIYVFIQEKFLLSSKNFDQASVRNLLENRIGDAIIEDLIYILKICDAGKYSPARKEEKKRYFLKQKLSYKTWINYSNDKEFFHLNNC